MKFAGYDAVFFTGIADRPVYLLIDNGKAELKDASALWGKGTYETEDTLEAEYGKTAKVASARKDVSDCTALRRSSSHANGRLV